MANLNELMTNIANAIRTKKGTSETINAQNFPSEIENLPSGGGGHTLKAYLDITQSLASAFNSKTYEDVSDIIGFGDTENVTNFSSVFRYCSSLKVDPQLNYKNATSMVSIYERCSSLTSLQFNDTSKVTSMRYMCSECTNLKTVNQFSTISVTDMQSLFYHCTNLETDLYFETPNVTNLCNFAFVCKKIKNIYLSNTELVTDFFQMVGYCDSLINISPLNTNKCSSGRMDSMFAGCVLLPTIDITKLIDNASNFAYGCYSLTKLIIRTMDTIPILSSNAFTNCYHFTGTTNRTYNPDGLKDGHIYVPDKKVEKLKVATNWSVYADIIKPLSLSNGDHISNLVINNDKLSLTTPRNATIYLDGFTNTPTVNITVSNESVAQINNITTTTEKITFEVIALGEDGNATITVNVSGDYSKTLTIEVSYVTPMEYTVEAIEGATYGFTLNSEEYYESTNKKFGNSYSLCKLVFNVTEKNNILKLECINSGESNYDFGILSNIDTTLSLSNSEDTTNVYKSFKGQSSTTPVTITYPEATVGEHFIYIKYRKDSGGDQGNDSLQFKVIS